MWCLTASDEISIPNLVRSPSTGHRTGIANKKDWQDNQENMSHVGTATNPKTWTLWRVGASAANELRFFFSAFNGRGTPVPTTRRWSRWVCPLERPCYCWPRHKWNFRPAADSVVRLGPNVNWWGSPRDVTAKASGCWGIKRWPPMSRLVSWSHQSSWPRGRPCDLSTTGSSRCHRWMAQRPHVQWGWCATGIRRSFVGSGCWSNKNPRTMGGELSTPDASPHVEPLRFGPKLKPHMDSKQGIWRNTWCLTKDNRKPVLSYWYPSRWLHLWADQKDTPCASTSNHHEAQIRCCWEHCRWRPRKTWSDWRRSPAALSLELEIDPPFRRCWWLKLLRKLLSHCRSPTNPADEKPIANNWWNSERPREIGSGCRPSFHST